MSPRDRDVIIHNGTIKLEGWSYSGGGNWVERVEVSPDGYGLMSIHYWKVIHTTLFVRP